MIKYWKDYRRLESILKNMIAFGKVIRVDKSKWRSVEKQERCRSVSGKRYKKIVRKKPNK